MGFQDLWLIVRGIIGTVGSGGKSKLSGRHICSLNLLYVIYASPWIFCVEVAAGVSDGDAPSSPLKELIECCGGCCGGVSTSWWRMVISSRACVTSWDSTAGRCERIYSSRGAQSRHQGRAIACNPLRDSSSPRRVVLSRQPECLTAVFVGQIVPERFRSSRDWPLKAASVRSYFATVDRGRL